MKTCKIIHKELTITKVKMRYTPIRVHEVHVKKIKKENKVIF